VEACVLHLRDQCGSKIYETLPSADSVLLVRDKKTKFQHQLTVVIESVLSPRIIAELPPRDRRRMESSREVSGERFFSTRPTEPTLTLSDSEYRVAMAVNLGSMPAMLRLPEKCICQTPFNGTVSHFHHCEIMLKFINRLHNGIRDELHAIILEIGCRSQLELQESSHEARLRPDLTVTSSQGRFLVDISTVCTTAPSYLNNVPAAARVRREREKHAKYDQIAANENSTVVPFVIDTYGGLGIEAAQFLLTLAC
jgi:hypothetical protein